MSDEIYVVSRGNTTEKRRDLTKPERDKFLGKYQKSLHELGGKWVLRLWGISGKWTNISLLVFPSIHAYLTHREAFQELHADRYWVTEDTICTRVAVKSDTIFDTSQVWEENRPVEAIYIVHEYNQTAKSRNATEKEIEALRNGVRKCLEEAGAKSAYLRPIDGDWESMRLSSFPNMEAYVSYRRAVGFAGLDVERYVVEEPTICKRVVDSVATTATTSRERCAALSRFEFPPGRVEKRHRPW
jgi:hypothetical protein